MIKVMNPAKFWMGMARARVLGSKPRVYSPESFYREKLDGLGALLDDREALDALLLNGTRLYADEGSLTTDRTPEFLDWRYAQHPFIDYRTGIVTHAGKVAACAVFRTNTRFGIREVVLSELLLSFPDVDLVKRLLRQLKSALKADYLVTYFKEGSW